MRWSIFDLVSELNFISTAHTLTHVLRTSMRETISLLRFPAAMGSTINRFCLFVHFISKMQLKINIFAWIFEFYFCRRKQVPGISAIRFNESKQRYGDNRKSKLFFFFRVSCKQQLENLMLILCRDCISNSTSSINQWFQFHFYWSFVFVETKKTGSNQKLPLN